MLQYYGLEILLRCIHYYVRSYKCDLSRDTIVSLFSYRKPYQWIVMYNAERAGERRYRLRKRREPTVKLKRAYNKIIKTLRDYLHNFRNGINKCQTKETILF